MRAAKMVAYVLGGLIALLVLALLLIVAFVDPNDYRDDIERIVQTETGRKLTLGGELKLAIFPWIALETGPASLADAPGFGDEPFVAIENARVGVRVLPLLRGKVEVGTVTLDAPRIRLITDANGRNNWADLGESSPADATPQTAAAPATLPTIAGLAINDASVTLENRQENSRRVVRDFNLATGRLVSGEPFDVKSDLVFDQDESLSVKAQLAGVVTADLERNVYRLAKPTIDLVLSGPSYPQSGIPVQIGAGAIESDLNRQTHRLDGFTLTTTWRGEGLPAAGVPIALQAKALSADLARQTVDAPELYADIAGAKLSAMLTGQEVLDAPRVSGRLALAPVALREWLPKLGIELPRTRDASVFEKLSFASNLAMTKSSAELDNITLQLDATTATGTLAIADIAAKALRFDLSVNRIDADRYLPPPVEAPANAPKRQEPPTEIPVEALRDLNARGELRVGEAIFAGIKFTKLRLGINGRDGQLRFHPIEASMYGGAYRGDIRLDATGEVARVALDEHLSSIDFAPLFKDFLDTDRVSGKGSANLKLSGSGRTTDDVMQTLDGTVDFKVVDGALEGADLWYEIRRARAVLKQQPIPQRSGPVRTPFSSLQGTGTMANGVLTNNDLNVAMQYLKVSGEGTVDIPKSTLDYRLVATVLKIPREGAIPAAEQDLVDARIPVKVSGALTDPTVRPDIEGYLKDQVKQKLDQEQQKLEEKVKDKLGDKLKGLFGR